MDQVKEILRQAIKYRFWIALGISLITPVIAYVIGSGPVKEESVKQTAAIESAKKDVETYASGVAYNKQYQPIIEGKTAELDKDVRKSWKKLYDRQAPLLTWPERVQERFTTWGRKWPENEDASRVQFAIIDYVQSYPKFVNEVYNSFKPFDYEQGTGVVAAPPENALLRPAPFKENDLPDLGKVWAAQERLWIQRSLLDVVAEVNKNAKSWDGAAIKQVKALEVGSPSAQDQVSIANAETLVEADAITDPKAPPPAEPASSGAEGAMMGMMGGGGQQEKLDTVFYLQTTAGTAAPYKIMPVEMVVLVEQDRIQDFLTALENSPMSIQVKEFAMSRPAERVSKPEKGQNQNSYGYGEMGGLINRMMPRMRGAVGGFGGLVNRMPMGPGPAGSMGGGAPGKGGVDKRGTDRRKKGEEGKEEEVKPKRPSAQDPYFNVVEVTVYGQVRFYNPPPPEPAAEPDTASPGETPAPGAEADAKKEGDTPKAEGEMPAAEPAKEGEAKKEGEAPAEDEKAAMPKDDDAAKKDESKKDESKKEEPKKGEGEAPKKDEAAKEKTPDAKAEEPAKAKDAAPKADESPKKDSDAAAPKK
ncbi:MAG: hypothetical protein P4L84_38015 [Isosphaeraceae bacterium]|nr:hypothetical protein [Isosphaeraceae bacterium]